MGDSQTVAHGRAPSQTPATDSVVCMLQGCNGIPATIPEVKSTVFSIKTYSAVHQCCWVACSYFYSYKTYVNIIIFSNNTNDQVHDGRLRRRTTVGDRGRFKAYIMLGIIACYNFIFFIIGKNNIE